jgi:hypothetical protein
MFAFLVLSKIDIGVGMEVVGTPSKFISYVEDVDKKYSMEKIRKGRTIEYSRIQSTCEVPRKGDMEPTSTLWRKAYIYTFEMIYLILIRSNLRK